MMENIKDSKLPEQRETLYNGIELPAEWPPRNIDQKSTEPMPVPYLKNIPARIPIDIGRQLFMDDFLIEKSDMKRVFHSPEKYAANPIFKPETEMEINPGGNAVAAPKSGGIWWDPKEKIFKMWYEAGWINTIAYAISTNGLNWSRPMIPFDINGTNFTGSPAFGCNQVLPMDLRPDSWTVVPDWDAEDPQERYKMYMHGPSTLMLPAVCMTSPDGMYWTRREWSGPSGDRSTMFYNPFRKKWIFSLREYPPRSRRYWEADDFMKGCKWNLNEPVFWARADKNDPLEPGTDFTPQLYNLDAVAYESIMLGFFEILRGSDNDISQQTGFPKTTELTFAYSRDGFHWDRPDRSAHIPAERKDVWDRGYVQSLGNICCVRGDKLWIYYTGFRGDSSKAKQTNWVKDGMYNNGSTGLAFLRRDGFASMEAGTEKASLTTRPLVFNGSKVFVNAALNGGELRVEILNEEGKLIAPYTYDNSLPFTGDSTLQEMEWKGADNVSSLKGKAVRFRFTLNKGAIYSFWVSRDASGRSDGYVAGGGRGHTGMTDTVGKAALEEEQKLSRDLNIRFPL